VWGREVYGLEEDPKEDAQVLNESHLPVVIHVNLLHRGLSLDGGECFFLVFQEKCTEELVQLATRLPPRGLLPFVERHCVLVPRPHILGRPLDAVIPEPVQEPDGLTEACVRACVWVGG
jgi:hypothetical protein